MVSSTLCSSATGPPFLLLLRRCSSTSGPSGAEINWKCWAQKWKQKYYCLVTYIIWLNVYIPPGWRPHTIESESTPEEGWFSSLLSLQPWHPHHDTSRRWTYTYESLLLAGYHMKLLKPLYVQLEDIRLWRPPVVASIRPLRRSLMEWKTWVVRWLDGFVHVASLDLSNLFILIIVRLLEIDEAQSYGNKTQVVINWDDPLKGMTSSL